MIVLKMTEDAQCPSCKVIISRHGFRANCPYCGTYFDPRRRSFQEAQIRTTSSMRRLKKNTSSPNFCIVIPTQKYSNNFTYCKVTSSNMSCLELHTGFFRLLKKGIFDPYVL